MKRFIICLKFLFVYSAILAVTFETHAKTVVPVNVHWDQSLVDIPDKFYGVNIGHRTLDLEIPASKARLFTTLKPDAVRLFTQRRYDANNVDYELYGIQSPNSTAWTYDWTRLDDMMGYLKPRVKQIYLGLGFGPPQVLWADPAHRTPPAPSMYPNYAQFMTTVVNHYVKQGYPIDRVTVDNEPENVGYTIPDYVNLFKQAYPKIHQFSPSVSVGGPINGYDYWDTLGFGAAMTKFIDGLISANAHLPDHLDWHVYTKDTDKLLGTVSGVQGIYSARNLTAPKIVLSEINRNSVVSGDGQPQSADDNTGWPSVSWLSYVYDKLQAAGVDQAFYFCLHETTLGLISRDYDVVRPNYYTMWAMTNQMGRHRLAVDDLSGSKLGAIATNDGDVRRLFIYNTNTDDTGDAYITLGNTLIHQTLTFTKTWYGNNSGIPTDAKISLPQWSHPPANGQILVPAGGWVILDLTPPSIYRLKNASGNFSYALKKDINPVPTGWTIDEKVGSVVTTDNGVAPSGMVPLYHFNNASTGEDLLLTSLALKLSWYQNSANGFVGTQMGYVYSSATAAPTGAAHLYQAGSRNGGNNHLYTNDLQEYKGLGINSWIMQGTLFYFVPQ